MSERELQLEAKLSFLDEQLFAAQENNTRLCSEIDLAYAREKANLEDLKKLKKQLNDAVAEKEILKEENDGLRFRLSAFRQIIKDKELMEEWEATHSPQTLCGCNQSSRSTSDVQDSENSYLFSAKDNSNEQLTMGSLRNEIQKSMYLEQQIIALTRDKKQLMTHLHWLSRQRTDRSRQDYIPCQLESEAKNVSLEEGNGAKFESLLATLSSSNAHLRREKINDLGNSSHLETKHFAKNTEYDGGMGKLWDTKNREQLRDEQVEERVRTNRQPTERHPTERQFTQSQPTERRLTERQLKEKLESLKATMLAVKEIVAKNNETCRGIFQLSFQNIKHPNEPRSYRTWSSLDEEHISSLVKSQENMNLLQTNRSFLSYPEMKNGESNSVSECQGVVGKRAVSALPAKLLEREESVINQNSAKCSSLETGSKTISPLSRSLSDLGTMYRPLARGSSERLPLARESPRPFLSTFVNADLKSARCNTGITDFQTMPCQFSSTKRVVKQPPTESSDDNSQLFQNSSPPLSDPFSENLIS